jgi:hypothetical protein
LEKAKDSTRLVEGKRAFQRSERGRVPVWVAVIAEFVPNWTVKETAEVEGKRVAGQSVKSGNSDRVGFVASVWRRGETNTESLKTFLPATTPLGRAVQVIVCVFMSFLLPP